MFTGIVEAVGRVLAVEPRGELVGIAVEAPPEIAGLEPGDSVSVSGCCLTATSVEGPRVLFDAVPETLEKTALRALRPGGGVNLERALRADGRLDGHIVQGHVDGTAAVRELAREGSDVRLRVACGPELLEHLVPKGSVALDGVSLTVVDVHADGFDVALIPFTLEATTLGEKGPGDLLNVEVDVLSKYVKRHLERLVPPRG